jgi:K+/H+ antiporter YhaU regulatory subunit KhtT
MPPRRFPPPWTVDKIPGGHIVRDADGQALAYIYSRENEAEALQAKVLTKDEARRIARNIARLPNLLGRRGRLTMFIAPVMAGPDASHRSGVCTLAQTRPADGRI